MHTRTHIHNVTLHTCLGLGGVVTAIDCPPDQVFSLEEIERVYYDNLYYYQEHIVLIILHFQALLTHKPVLVYACHGESSTGTCQPLTGIGDVCHRYQMLNYNIIDHSS